MPKPRTTSRGPNATALRLVRQLAIVGAGLSVHLLLQTVRSKYLNPHLGASGVSRLSVFDAGKWVCATVSRPKDATSVDGPQ